MRFFSLSALLVLITGTACAQTDFSGTYRSDIGSTIALVKTGNQYRGALTYQGVAVPLVAQAGGPGLNGSLFDENGSVITHWQAAGSPQGFTLSLQGLQMQFVRIAGPASGQSASASPNRGLAQTQRSSGSLAARIAGSRLYWMSKGSMLSSTSTSSYGEIDFCPNGQFVDHTQSSFNVEGGNYNYNTGTYDAGAAGATNSRSSGRWGIQNGSLILQYHNGRTVQHALRNVQNGSWYQGRVKFAMDWGKGQCR